MKRLVKSVAPLSIKDVPRIALFSFAYNEKEREGGYACFDNFVVDEPMSDRTSNLPIGKVISLCNLSNGTYAWANPHGMLHSAGKGSREYQNGGCFSRCMIAVKVVLL